MDLGLTGARVAVAGSTRGIGRVIAQRFLEEGAQVFVGSREAEAVERAVADLSGLGSVTGTVLDAGQPDLVRAWVRQAIESLGGLDVYVHNVSAKSNRSTEGWTRNFQIDLMALVHGVDEAKDALADGGGCVVSVTTTSVAEHFGGGAGGYTAFKAAVTNWTLGQAQVLGARGVRCNVVAPGPTDTGPQGDWAAIRTQRPEYVAAVEAAHPGGSMVADTDVADAVVFLASARARHVNGANVSVDAGFLKRVNY